MSLRAELIQDAEEQILQFGIAGEHEKGLAAYLIYIAALGIGDKEKSKVNALEFVAAYIANDAALTMCNNNSQDKIKAYLIKLAQLKKEKPYGNKNT